MTELETVIRAKKYIDNLANGINPLSGEMVDDKDIINNVRISRCLFYVSNILGQVIDNGGQVKKNKSNKVNKEKFNLTDEQIESLIPHMTELSATKVLVIINEQIDSNYMKKLKLSTLLNWLINKGLLRETTNDNGRTVKLPTDAGIMLGLSEKIYSDLGIEKRYTVYNKNAQQFIFDNLHSIIEFSNEEEKNVTIKNN